MQKSVFCALFIAAFIVWGSSAVTYNVNARVNNQVYLAQVFLEAGTYRVSPIGAADRGAFNAWSGRLSTSYSDGNACQRTIPTRVRGWRNADGADSPHITVASVEGTPLLPVSVESDLSSPRFILMTSEETKYRADDGFVHPPTRSALARTPSSFIPSDSGTVGFTIHDTGTLSGDRGGISLDLTPVVQDVTVTINAPHDSASFATGEEIVFEGVAVDANGNPFPPSSLRWNSDRDDQLGTGQRLVIQASDLSVGSHTITCEAINEHSVAVGTARIPVTIVDEDVSLQGPLYPVPVPIFFVLVRALADVNADGVIDLITPNSVALGNGDGTFKPAQEINAEVRGVTAVADLDGDGLPDLIGVAGARTLQRGFVEVLRGNGDGTFESIWMLAFNSGLDSVAVDDLNHDSHLDIITWGSHDIFVLLGNGDGTFQDAQSYDLSQFYSDGILGLRIVQIADLNEDSHPDLVTSYVLLLGNGDGSFQPPRSLFRSRLHPLAIADLNGDGHLDIVGNREIRLGNGDGTFQVGSRVSVSGFTFTAVALADMDDDGHLDMVAARADTISVLLGNGDGTFQPPQEFPFPGSRSGVKTSIALADLDADGQLDVVANSIVYFGNGDGTLQAAQESPAGGKPQTISAADLNRDGLADVVATIGKTVAVLLGNGDGSFQPPQKFGAEARSGHGALAVSDVNGDGFLDLVTTSIPHRNPSRYVSVMLGNGDGTFRPLQQFFTGTSPFAVVIADFNEDSYLDLVTANGRSEDVSLILGNGDGTFQAAQFFAVSEGLQGLAIADINADGHLDLVTDEAVLLGNGDGTFQTPIPLSPDNGYVVVADLDNDGHLDLIVGGRVLRGNGDGTFQRTQVFAGGSHSTVIADLNADGALDVVGAGRRLAVFLGNGDVTFQDRQEFATCNALSAAIADVDGDGQLDLIAANHRESDSTCDTVSVLLHR